MSNISLCKCGIDLTEHHYAREWESAEDVLLPAGEHWFDSSGTRHRCEKFIETSAGIYLCPRPGYHQEEGVECGPLTGKKLW